MKGPKGLTDEFYGFVNSSKRSIVVIDSYLKDSAFNLQQLKGMYHLLVEGIPKGYLFGEKLYIKG